MKTVTRQAFRLAWSYYRRRRQAQARHSHYHRQQLIYHEVPL